MIRQSERGNAMLISVFLLVIITMFGVGLVGTTTTDLKMSDNYMKATQALYASEAGAQYAVARLNADRTIGNSTPNPSATPLYTGSLAGYDYKVWIWNQQYFQGSGRTMSFDVAGSRQVVVEASNGKRTTRKLSTVVAPNTPRALKKAIFSCGAITLSSTGNDDISGDVFASGNVSYSSQLSGSLTSRASVTLPNGDIAGNVMALGTIDNANASRVDGLCRAGGDISRTGRCDTFVKYSTTAIKDICNPAVSAFDVNQFSLSSAEIDAIEAATPIANVHTGGWFITAATSISGTHFVTGNAYFTGAAITYSGDTVIVVENGSLICSDCTINPAASTDTLAIITAGSTGGIISFNASATKTSVINGTLWAGVVNGTTMPTLGSVSVSGFAQVTVNGSVVALAPTGSVSSSSMQGALIVNHVAMTPSVFFGAQDAFAIAEWKEVRQ